MFKATHLAGFGGRRDIIRANLQLLLDAASYPGSGQTWTDLSSNAFVFNLGASSGAEASDPTFNAGSPAYFSFDGGDFFSASAAYLGTFLRSATRQDKNYTIEGWVYRGPTINTNEALFSNMTAVGTSKGTTLYIDGTVNKMTAYIQGNERGSSTTQVPVGVWRHLAFAGRHDGSTCTFYQNGAADGTYSFNDTTFTSGDSDDIARIACFGSGPSEFMQSGSRLAIVRGYDRALSSTEIAQNFAAERSRFGI